MAKKTENYWDKRALKRLDDAEKMSEEYIKRVKKIYDKAFKDVETELESVYRNYSKKTGLDVQKLRELLSKKETDKVWKTLKRQGLDKYIKQNYKARISRLEKVQAQIYAKAKLIYPKEELEQTMCYRGVVNDSYYKAVYDTQMGTGYNFSFSKIDDNLMTSLLNERWSGKNYSQIIWGNTDILADSLSEILGGALMSGQSMQKTAKDIKDRFKVSKYYAERLIRTETNHFHNMADAIAYEEMGIEYYVFVATLDNRTSAICQSMDGKKFAYKDKEEGVNFPPLHPNCRSKTRGYLGEEGERSLKRRARNPITNKTELVDNISYKEWVKKNGLVKAEKPKKVKPKKVVKPTEIVNKKVKQVSNDVYKAYQENGYENLALMEAKTGKMIGNINNIKSISSVDYSDVQKDLMKNHHRDLYAIHNHPANHTFSLQDLYETFENDALSGIMVRTDDHIYYFIPKIEDMDVTKENLAEFKDWFEKKLGNTNDEMFSKYPMKSNNELQHLAFKKIFSNMEWKYGRKKL